jgi:hypothetical protein
MICKHHLELFDPTRVVNGHGATVLQFKAQNQSSFLSLQGVFSVSQE